MVTSYNLRSVEEGFLVPDARALTFDSETGPGVAPMLGK